MCGILAFHAKTTAGIVPKRIFETMLDQLPLPLSSFESVRKLKPGHYLRVANGEVIGRRI